MHIDHLRTLRRLRRVNEALRERDELDAMQRPPPGLRSSVPAPMLDRETLQALQAELIAALGEMELRYTRG